MEELQTKASSMSPIDCKVNSKCAPQYLDNEREFAVIKKLWNFLKSGHLANLEKLKQAIAIITRPNFNKTLHTKDLSLVTRIFTEIING